jgi:hypothetical protein
MSFYEDVIQKDPRFRSTADIRDLALLEPDFRDRVQKLMADAKAMGVELMITETYRSAERQEMLFEQKATQLKTVGVHHYGLAVDFAKLESGKAEWGGDWSFLGDLCRKYGLIWGGDWGTPLQKHTFRDMDHVQGCTVQQQAGLFNGSWYPGAPKLEGPTNA